MSQSRLTFFRQSGWLVIATTMSGAFMYAVHKVAGTMPKAEYGVFTTLLQVVNLMGIPAAALSTVFAQQAAAAVTEREQHQLKGTVRTLFLATLVVWVAAVVAAFLLQHQLLAEWKITNPASLWITVGVGLAALWMPIVSGVMQGRQNFLWLGGVSILNGVGRFVAVSIIVLLLGGLAAGAMTAALIGFIMALGVGLWQTTDLWRGPREPMDWPGWLRRVVPLTLGLGSTTFMLSADMLVVQRMFDREQTGFYAAAGMIGRALVFFTAPLTAVMFPKIVQSAAKAEKTDVLALAVGATALLGLGAAIVCTLFPTLPLRMIYDKSFLPVSGPLVPWFAWCMLPLTLANVLVNNLLARRIFSVVPWLAIVAAGYGVALFFFATTFESVIQTLGVFSLLMFFLAAWFTWRP